MLDTTRLAFSAIAEGLANQIETTGFSAAYIRQFALTVRQPVVMGILFPQRFHLFLLAFYEHITMAGGFAVVVSGQFAASKCADTWGSRSLIANGTDP